MSSRSPQKLPADHVKGWQDYLEKHKFPGIKTGQSAVGRAVFAARPFKTGEQVLTFHGPVLSGTVGRELSDTVQIDWDRYVDPIPPVKFVNHDCDPNTGLKNEVELHALRDIPEGEEIRFDYSTCMGEAFWTMECHCGSPKCRGVIRDFALLPRETSLRYLELGIVQPFLTMNRFSALELAGMRDMENGG